MIRIGITGGIGSGKSVVSEILSLSGVPVFIADTEAKLLINTSQNIRKALCELFGNDLYTDQGLDKKRLASIIFNDPKRLQTVNNIVHPEVGRAFIKWVQEQKGDLCAIESAILFESGFDSLVDKTVTVYAPEAIRIKRACSRDYTTEDNIRQRIKHQLPEEIKKERSDFVIYNDDQKALIPQIYALLTSLHS
ncbi:dephospho-CoA kinase [Massilibacteroides sp.]|uniref:dephospho-CoA kinase n=1 Tax=Massilibacteroides sp. TaxID=2034766 RepID=UPI002606E04D|nr:dephospho-CoA kinase [Massilibacteroides sp.]MDD4514309.1 dephospho-CoA kinase [Massilibacteroides sp.]